MAFFDFLFANGEQERGDDLDRKLAEMNQRDYAPGGRLYSGDANYQVVQNHLATGATGNVNDQIKGAFGEGWNEGKTNVNKTIFGGVKNFLGAIPFSVWLIVAAVLFFSLGGVAMVKKQLQNA